MINDSTLLLEDVTITRNTSVADTSRAVLQGGGIWNGAAFGVVSDPPADLTLTGSRITGNALVAPNGADLSGAGIFTEVPVLMTDTVLAANRPDQCTGCSDLTVLSPERSGAHGLDKALERRAAHVTTRGDVARPASLG